MRRWTRASSWRSSADSSRDESGSAVCPRIVECVPTGEQRQERGSGNDLDEFSRGDVGPYLAACGGLRQAIRQTARQDVGEALQQGGVQRQIGGHLSDQAGQRGPRSGGGQHLRGAANHLAHVTGERSRFGYRGRVADRENRLVDKVRLAG